MAWSNGYITINHEWLFPIFMIAYIAVFTFIVEITRRYRFAQLFCWIILPFIFIPILIIAVVGGETWQMYMFFIGKLFAVIIATLIIQLIRTKLKKWQENGEYTKARILMWSMYFILFFNILDAVFHDLALTLRREQFIVPGNAIYGIILCLTQANPTDIKTTNDGYNSMIYRLGSFWIFNYTVWVSAFLYISIDCFDVEGILQWINTVAIQLGIPIIMTFWSDCDQWMQHRAYTLLLWVWVYTMPMFKWYLPWFFYVQECEENRKNGSLVLRILNYIALLLGILLILKQIYDEIKEWKERKAWKGQVYDKIKKPYGISLLQWIVRKMLNIKKVRWEEINLEAIALNEQSDATD